MKYIAFLLLLVVTVSCSENGIKKKVKLSSKEIIEIKKLIEINDYDKAFSKILKIEASIPYYTGKNRNSALCLIGDFYAAIEEYQLASVYKSLINKKYLNNKQKFFHYSGLGYLQFKSGQINKAKKTYNQQINFCSNVLKNSSATSSAYNNLGLVYYNNKEFDKSIFYYKIALEKIEKKNDLLTFFNKKDTLFKYAIFENIGKSYYSKGNYTKSISWLEKARKVIFYQNFGDSKNYYLLFKNYLFINDKNEANRVIINSKKIFKESKFYNIENDYLIKKMQLELKYHTSEHKDLNLFLLSNDKLIEQIKVSKNKSSEYLKLHHKNEIKKIRLNFLHKYKEEKEAIQQENAYHRIINVLLIFLSLILILAITYISKNFKKIKSFWISQIDKIKKEKEIKDIEVKLKSSALLNASISVKEFDLLIDDFNSKFLKILNQDDNKNDFRSQMKTLITELKIRKSLNTNLNDFRSEQMDELFSFEQKLIENHHDLNKNEIQLCLLIVKNLKNKDIALVKNTTIHAVKISKYRLKQKLKLDENNSLFEYLKQFI